jgi:hypothetical protein
VFGKPPCFGDFSCTDCDRSWRRERERERERERCDHNIFGVGFVLFVVGCGDSGRILFAFFWRCITGSL